MLQMTCPHGLIKQIFREFVKVLRHEGQIKFIFLEVGSLSSVNFVGIKIFMLIGCSGSEAVHIVCCFICFTLSGSADGVSEGSQKLGNLGFDARILSSSNFF